MRTLVINLTRLGDLMQTQPVFSALKARGDATALVCLQNFQGAAGLLRDVDQVFGVPGAALLAAMDASWPAALGLFLQWTQDIRRLFDPQQVVCLTPSLPARLLARAIRQGNVTGFGLDGLGFGAYSTPWAAFLEASSLHRGSSPFNIVDLFLEAAHMGRAERVFRLAPPSDVSCAAVRQLVAAQNPPEHAGLLGVQLGASAARRQWPVARFAALADGLWESHRLLPALLGGPGEEGLAEAFAQASRSPFVNLVGRTGLEELAACVAGLRLLATNDTGTMHLAAGHGVPVLAVFLATAQPFDTGPYLEGCCCLEPDMACHPCGFNHACALGESCRDAAPHQAALHLARGFLDSGRWPEARGQGVRVWESFRDTHGFMDLRSLSGHDHTDRAVWNRLQRQLWRRFLDDAPLELEPGVAYALSAAFRDDHRQTLAQVSALLGVLTQQAQVVKVSGNKAMRTKFMATWQRVQGLLASKPALVSLSHLWMHLSQTQGDGLDGFQAFAGRVGQLVALISSLLDDHD